MKKLKCWQWLLIVAIILVVVGCAVSSIIYDIAKNNNAVTMLAGLWSAFATLFLGGIAVWQNKSYKELSDKSSKETSEIQENIMLLTEKTMNAIETLKKIEMSKYYPLVERMPQTYHGISKKLYLKEFDKDFVIQPTMINMDINDILLPIGDLYEKYNSCSFVVKNTSEKAIRHFNCYKLRINGNEPAFIVKIECDILPGQNALVSILNFPEYKKDEIDVEIEFTLNNLVMDKYIIRSEFIITFDNDHPNFYEISFTFPEIYVSNEEELVNGQA